MTKHFKKMVLRSKQYILMKFRFVGFVLKMICIHGWAVILCILVNNPPTIILLQGSNNIAALNIFCYLRKTWKTFERYKRSFCFVLSFSMNHNKSIYYMMFYIELQETSATAQYLYREIPLESGSKRCSYADLKSD